MKVILILDMVLSNKGISQNELSRLTGIRQPTIIDMCQNKTKSLPLVNLAKICEVVECEITDIIKLKESLLSSQRLSFFLFLYVYIYHAVWFYSVTGM